MTARTYLAFDYGMSRMGVAVGQTVSGSATALSVLHIKNGKPQPKQLDKLMKDWAPDGFILGMPDAPQAEHDMNIARRVKSFADYLRRRYSKPCFFIDERLSSRIAEAHYADGVQEDLIHSLVAQTLLNDWLRRHSARQNGE